MIVFNKGSQSITFSGGVFFPGKSVNVATEHEEEAKKLVARYPRVLSEGGVDAAEAKKAIANKDAEIATLRAQNAKLKRLLAASGISEDDEPEAISAPPTKEVAPEPERAPAVEVSVKKTGGKRTI